MTEDKRLINKYVFVNEKPHLQKNGQKFDHFFLKQPQVQEKKKMARSLNQ